jgi:hypothetical protein
MKTYEFDVVLKGVSEVTDDQANRLFAAGCDDATPAGCDGVVWIHFNREAASLEEAVATAVAQVQAAGFLVSKVELDVAAAVSLGTGKAYVLVQREVYEQLRGLLEDEPRVTGEMVDRLMEEEDRDDPTLAFYQQQYGGKP